MKVSETFPGINLIMTDSEFDFFAAVILNEHLTEALRRLKRDASADSVDRYVSFFLPLESAS